MVPNKFTQWLVDRSCPVVERLMLSGHLKTAALIARFVRRFLLGKKNPVDTTHHHAWRMTKDEEGFFVISCRDCGEKLVNRMRHIARTPVVEFLAYWLGNCGMVGLAGRLVAFERKYIFGEYVEPVHQHTFKVKRQDDGEYVLYCSVCGRVITEKNRNASIE